jgi:hypothetical protein
MISQIQPMTSQFQPTENMILINDTYENVSNNLKQDKDYIIYLPEHNIKLLARVYYFAKMGTKLDFMIMDDSGKDIFGIGFDKRDFQHIEYFKWDQFEKCQIYMD